MLAWGRCCRGVITERRADADPSPSLPVALRTGRPGSPLPNERTGHRRDRVGVVDLEGHGCRVQRVRALVADDHDHPVLAGSTNVRTTF